MFYSAGTQQGGQILKYLTNANKYPPPLFLSHHDAAERICAFLGIGKCLECFIITNEVDCRRKGCLWNEDNYHLCYDKP